MHPSPRMGVDFNFVGSSVKTKITMSCWKIHLSKMGPWGSTIFQMETW